MNYVWVHAVVPTNAPSLNASHSYPANMKK